MPQRRGFLRRVLDFFTGSQGPPEAASTPSQPPPQPATPREQQAIQHEQGMQAIYRQIRGLAHDPRNLIDYQDWRETFDHFEPIFDGDEEIEQGWDEYLRAYYLTTDEAGHVPREDFHNDTGIPRSEIDWDLWRALRRGTT